VAAVHLLTTADENIAGYSGADFRRLSAAAACDRFGKHQLVESPEQADIILFVGSTYPDHRDVRSHPLLRLYANKCFLFQSDDYVIPFLPGVYVNIAKRWYSDRTVTGPYLQMTQWEDVPYIPSLAGCKFLFCFVGSTRTHGVRRRLMGLKHPRAYLEDTSALVPSTECNKAFVMVEYQQGAKTHYGEIISRSKFVLCPRGYACSTWRLFETMKAGRVPVIVSDQWVPPAGPAWETFSIRVKQNQVGRIPSLLEEYESEAEAMGGRARATWDEWFSRETVFHRVVEWCLSLKHRSQDANVSSIMPYVQLLRPFYLRHVLLPEIKLGLSHHMLGVQRFLSGRFFWS
jgi:Exostosin family